MRNRNWAYAAIIIAASLWGFGFVFGKLALREMPYGATITFRFAVAAIALLPVVFWRRISISRRDLLYFAIAGILYVPLQFLLQFAGLAKTSLTHASLIVALLPALIALASLTFTRNAQPQWWPIVASAAGAIIVVVRPGGTATILGDALVLLSLAGAVGWVLFSERFVRRYDAIVSSAYILWMGTAALLCYELVVSPHDLVAHYSATAWAATVASGVFCTAVTTVFWNVGLRIVPASDAGVFINLEPLIGSGAGILFFGDACGWTVALGGALIIAGAVWVTKMAAPAQEFTHLALEPEYWR
ncbi:MAG: DMT family transporter [Vulcanimicrobiaceae bacterium]